MSQLTPVYSSIFKLGDDTDQKGVLGTFRRIGMNWKVGIIVMSVGILAGGCFSPDPVSLNSDSPASAIPAIKQAADNNDRKAIPRLVDDLNDPDPAIRFAAIQALEKMTGQTLQYQYYDDELERRSAVQRWRQWLKDQPVQ
jgi:hypothetical protein